MHKFWPELR